MKSKKAKHTSLSLPKAPKPELTDHAAQKILMRQSKFRVFSQFPEAERSICNATVCTVAQRVLPRIDAKKLTQES